MQYIARGKKTMEQLAAQTRRIGEERILIIEENRRETSALAVAAVNERAQWQWIGAIGMTDGE